MHQLHIAILRKTYCLFEKLIYNIFMLFIKACFIKYLYSFDSLRILHFNIYLYEIEKYIDID